MGKNLVLCCDGTANEFAAHNTNVVKLHTTLISDPERQVIYYHPGLGTMEPAGALTPLTRRVTKLLGLAMGYGLDRDIRDAYVFLMNNFEEGDRIFLFGFSRGAYTARAVAAALHLYGLVPRGNEALVPYVIRMMLAIQRGKEKGVATSEYFELAKQFKATMARPCKPWFVGVWDTVNSVGWIENPLRLPYVTKNPDIAIGRHAVSIDERRAFYRNHLWRLPDDPTEPAGPKDLKQVWFAGVHCDVGGGYAEEESGLAKIALEWMLDEAEAAGLLVDLARRRKILGENGGSSAGKGSEPVFVPPNPHAEAHESLKGPWWLGEYVPKRYYEWKTRELRWRCNRGHRRWIPSGSLVHESVRERGADYCARLPRDVVFVGKSTAQPSTAEAAGDQYCR